eukprot:1180010-Prorocentrum_minimum.AAC.2
MSPHAIGSRHRHMPCPLTPVARATGICHFPSRHWLAPRAYAISPHVIGSRHRHMPCPLTPLAHATGMTFGRMLSESE